MNEVYTPRPDKYVVLSLASFAIAPSTGFSDFSLLLAREDASLTHGTESRRLARYTLFTGSRLGSASHRGTTIDLPIGRPYPAAETSVSIHHPFERFDPKVLDF